MIARACFRKIHNRFVGVAISTRAYSLSRCGIVCVALLLTVGCDYRVLGREELIGTKADNRPRVHFTPRENWMNDPNGPVFVDGRYHLFYQYNPEGAGWGNMSWGHASSTDLVQWREEPVAIARTDSTLIFSGGVVIDSLGSSGLCRGPRCLVAIYTAAHVQTNAQAQSLAFSEDGGASWSQFHANPVLDIGSTEFRDPYVFWHTPSEAWVMVVALATKHVIQIYRSSNLREWTLASEFGPRGATGGVWECPVLVELPLEDAPGTSRWMLKIDINPGHIAGGSGAQYFVGDFDGQRFNAPDAFPAQWVDFGPDFYCAQPWTRGNQVTWIAWMSNWQYAGQTPTAPWRGSMTLPRAVTLREVGGVPRLVQRPVASLERRRGLSQRFTFSRTIIPDVTPLNAFDSGNGDAYELRVHIEPGDAHEVGVLLRYSEAQHVLVSYDVDAGTIAIDRRPVPTHDFHPAFRARHVARLKNTAPIALRIIVDRSSVEVFADDGATVLTSLMFPDASSNGLALFSKGGAVDSVSVEAWLLQTPR